jgi:hypothetical protein
MRLSCPLVVIALLGLASSSLPLPVLAQASTEGGSGTGGATTLRAWCQQGHQEMCSQAKADREAAKSACQGQQQGQASDACQQARSKFKSDVQALHQAGAPAARRGRRGGAAQGGGDDIGGE